jgi:hypothetical protein
MSMRLVPGSGLAASLIRGGYNLGLQEVLESFRREIQIFEAVGLHPNVVRVSALCWHPPGPGVN